MSSKWFVEKFEEVSPREVYTSWTLASGEVVTAALTRSAFFTTQWDATVTRWKGREVVSVESNGSMGLRKAEARRWAEAAARRMAASGMR